MRRADLAFGGFRALTDQLFLYGLGYPRVTRDIPRPSATGGVDRLENFGRKPKVDPVQGANGGKFRISLHGAIVAPFQRSVYQCFAFVLAGSGEYSNERKARMRWRPHAYPVTIGQELNIDHLARLSEPDAEEAEETGYLAGNQMYQDLRGLNWVDVERVLEVEHGFIARLQGAEDIDAEAARIDDERLDCFEPEDALWELDVGVASATIALSALGAVPVGSCNAGGFGGRHQGAHPYVAFFLGAAVPDLTISIAQAAGVGLRNVGDGLVQIFGAGDLDLLRFAEVALDRCGPTRGPSQVT